MELKKVIQYLPVNEIHLQKILSISASSINEEFSGDNRTCEDEYNYKDEFFEEYCDWQLNFIFHSTLSELSVNFAL